MFVGETMLINVKTSTTMIKFAFGIKCSYFNNL
jgi:hypothetical protein